jgi:hypothetical protein
MRLFGLILLVLGLVGLVLGVLDAAGIPLAGGMHGYATWRGVGPMLAGLGLIGVGAYVALRRA